ncbi:hypothetical protein [Nocardia paucivorans]|uniref:hypothetical protein n=1 Tax=Nocardia paucivorans TaxID=114259 RepID=UPI0002F771AE|nr:hypothetical protein [Nocardia paucivorans]
MTVFRRDDAEVTRWVTRIVTRMHERAADIDTSIYQRLEDEIPELRTIGPAIELLAASVRENVATLLHALQHDIPPERVHLPSAAVEYTRRLAQRDVPVTALVRAYHVGQWRLTELFFTELEAVDIAPADRTFLAEVLTTRLFAYLDQFIQQVIMTYEHERELWLETGHSLRAVRVREVLDEERDVDIDEATATLRYPLHWYHLALIAWYTEARALGDELARLQRFVQGAAQASGVDLSPLVVADDRSCVWAWLPFRSPPSPAVTRVRDFAADAPMRRGSRSVHRPPGCRVSADHIGSPGVRGPSRCFEATPGRVLSPPMIRAYRRWLCSETSSPRSASGSARCSVTWPSTTTTMRGYARRCGFFSATRPVTKRLPRTSICTSTR